MTLDDLRLMRIDEVLPGMWALQKYSVQTDGPGKIPPARANFGKDRGLAAIGH